MRKYLTSTLAGLVLAAGSGIAAAHGTVGFGISLGVPFVPAPMYVAPPPVVYAPPPVYYAPARAYYAPAYYRPAPVVIQYRHKHRYKRHW